MEAYRIQTKRVSRSGYKAIRCFLADDKYIENDLTTQSHRTDALVWIGYDDQLKELILTLGNVNEIIDSEIRKFHSQCGAMFQALAGCGGESVVMNMIRIVEDFIRETVNDAYD